MQENNPPPTVVKKILNLTLSLAVLLLAVAISRYLFMNPPEEKKRRAPKRPLLSVETKSLAMQDYQVTIHGFGTVQPGSKGAVVSQIKGVITAMGDNVQAGSFFQKGELLFSIDDRDYLAALKITEAALSEARAKLLEEQARSDQALLNWKRLGKGEEATDLVLRKPYLATAQALVKSAEAKKEQAQLALERTQILAPYAGRVLENMVTTGQFVGAGTVLAKIYATDRYEVRLPLTRKQQQLLVLPHTASQGESPAVEIRSGQDGAQQWRGRIARTEATLDQKNQQLFVVVQLDSIEEQEIEAHELPSIGQFVEVSIQGKHFAEVFQIPSHTLYTNDEVIILKGGKLERRKVSVINRGSKYAVIKGGVLAGEQLVLTPLGSITSGTEAVVKGRRKREQ